VRAARANRGAAQALHAWREAARASSTTRRSVLLAWRAHCEARTVDAAAELVKERLADTFRTHQQRRLALRSFVGWRCIVRAARVTSARADVFPIRQQRRLLAASLAAWAEAAAAQQRAALREQRAERHLRARRLRAALRVWRGGVAAGSKVAQAAEQMRKRGAVRSVRAALAAWCGAVRQARMEEMEMRCTVAEQELARLRARHARVIEFAVSSSTGK
jgi:hypothetical protein